MYRAILTAQAEVDFEQIRYEGLKYRVLELIEELEKNPFPEKYNSRTLKGPMIGAHSVRINREHRMIYQVIPSTSGIGGIVKIIRMFTPYGGPLPPSQL